MIFVTGDTHGKFSRIEDFCQRFDIKHSDEHIMVILGDVGLNYYGDSSDRKRKKKLSKLPLTFFLVRGNHDARPESTGLYDLVDAYGGKAYVEKDFPNLIFAMDGELYKFPNYGKALVLGGGFSVEKANGLDRKFFENEQPTHTELIHFVDHALEENEKIDFILTHVAPLGYEPSHLFLDFILQEKVDKRVEIFLQGAEKAIEYKKWYFGHYHGDYINGNLRAMFNDIVELGR